MNPHTVVAAYAFLRETSPFNKWKLPPADEVEFHVTRHRDREADHTIYCDTQDHIIRVSAYYVKTTLQLMVAVAHEMVHMRQVRTGTESRRCMHNAHFKRTAKRVCQVHGFDFSTF